MKTQYNAQVLRVYIGDEDQFHGGPLYAAIVGKFKDLGIAGVTVFHGTEGYGTHGKLHTARLEVLFQGLPVVVEAVDTQERIVDAAGALDEMIVEGLYTIHEVTATRIVKNAKPDRSGGG